MVGLAGLMPSFTWCDTGVNEIVSGRSVWSNAEFQIV